MSKFSARAGTGKRLAEARKQKPKKARKPPSATQRAQIARYLSQDRGYDSLPD